MKTEGILGKDKVWRNTLTLKFLLLRFFWSLGYKEVSMDDIYKLRLVPENDIATRLSSYSFLVLQLYRDKF